MKFHFLFLGVLGAALLNPSPAAENPPAPEIEQLRDPVATYTSGIWNTVILLGSAGMKDPAQRKELLARLEPLREQIRKQSKKEIVAEMNQLEGILEYLGRGLETPAKGAQRYPDAKLNAKLNLQPDEYDERKVGRLAAQAIFAFADAAGTRDVLKRPR